ncbi:MAG TPA: SAM-dependent methyltransferase, partial [Intrasporangium sp.]|nr:SAM-dependent methyltransferase [Intrasporangium sp.]
MSKPRCRLCGAELTRTFVDLGMSPPCESYLEASQLDSGETFYPLHVRICSSCLLVQLPAYISGEEIFSHYAYFSSYSDSWVAHAKRFVDEA